jgi:dTDP-4-dehydrorhamnose 3,5-epimerase
MIYKNKRLMEVKGVTGNYINDVEITKLKKIPDERGSIYHMLRADDAIFRDFGEIYFSKIYPNAIKGWHLHKKMILNYAVIHGMIKLVLYDDREDSITRGNLMEIFMGDDNYILVMVPPMIWNGFKGIGNHPAILANCASIPHHHGEIIRKPPFSEDINYDWSLKHE